MKIMYVCTSPKVNTKKSSRVAGPRSQVEGVINALKRLGHQVSNVVVGNAFLYRHMGLRFGSVSRTRMLKLPLIDIIHICLQSVVDLYLCVRVFVEKPDVIYERYEPLRGRPLFRLFFRGRYIVEYSGVPSIEKTAHPSSVALRRLVRSRERASIDAADTAVFVSEDVRAAFMTYVGAEYPERSVIVPNAVDIARFQLPKTRPIEPFRFIFVGPLVKSERIDLLLRVLARLGHQSTVEAVIIGVGEQIESLRLLRDSLGLADRVRIPGTLPDAEVIAELLRANCGYSVRGAKLSGAKDYTAPVQLYEYLAAGLPFISQWWTDAAVITKQLGTQSLLCDVTEDSVFLSVDAALKVFSDEEICAIFSEKAHAIAGSQHTWERRMRALIGPARIDATKS